jgi:diaminohydroxyphosphoribosylaminopyrimidine deaminase/5-amino-6-(5-phosphoribosylamino)uracil reductase
MNSALDESLMRRAIELSRRGFPAPNPHVGCVLAHGEQIVGEGWHKFAGAPHAEAMALEEAGDRAKRATCYTTQEPCNAAGRRPPCSQALIRAGVARVVQAVRDPNPMKAGGMDTLRAAGIAVDTGLLEAEAAAANPYFLFRHAHGRPFVAVKAATTLDGFIARLDGTSKWITGPEARAEGHRLRAELGCVLVGRETVALDNPELTARLDGVVNQPVRAVLDPSGRLTGREKVFADAGAVWFVGGDQARLDAVATPYVEGGFDLKAVLEELTRRDVIGVLVEGGGRTIRSFLEAGLVDEIHLFQAPRLFGEGRPWAGGANLDLSTFAVVQAAPVGRDSHVILRRTA